MQRIEVILYLGDRQGCLDIVQTKDSTCNEDTNGSGDQYKDSQDLRFALHGKSKHGLVENDDADDRPPLQEDMASAPLTPVTAEPSITSCHLHQQ